MPTTAEVELISKTADLLVKYGFLGVGLVLLFLAAPAIDKLFNSRQIALLVASFGLAFLVAFGALDIVQKYFPSWISSKRVLISGAVLKVPQGYQVQIASDLRTAGAAYLKRENDPLNN